jgi:hypothetical protein
LYRSRALGFSFAFMAFAGAVGCVDRRPVGALRDGPRECMELATACEGPAEALGQPYQDCYEAGESKVSNACINVYYDCIERCRAAQDSLPAGGQGGAGGESGSDAGAGGR